METMSMFRQNLGSVSPIFFIRDPAIPTSTSATPSVATERDRAMPGKATKLAVDLTRLSLAQKREFVTLQIESHRSKKSLLVFSKTY